MTKSKGFPSQMFSLWVKFGTLSKNFFDFLTTKNTFSRKVPIIKVVRNGLNYKSGNLFFEKEILRNILITDRGVGVRCGVRLRMWFTRGKNFARTSE